MKNGTYIVNYQLMNMPVYIPGNFVNEPVDDYFRDIPTHTHFPASPEVFDLIGGNADNDNSKYLWNQILLEQSDDFIHVLSLKGIFLYCSPSSQKLLEYDSSELVGRSLSYICHPSDVVPVMRELKESSSGVDAVNLVYRIKRKNTGFMWIECQGKLRHLEHGKGRKCVILSGRERPVYRLIWKEVMNAALTTGADGTSRLLSDTEFWSKVSCDGLYLYTTSTCTNVLSFAQEEIVGMSLYQLVRSDRTTDVTRALRQAKEGKTVNMRHAMQNKKGQHVEVTSTFYPGDVVHGVGKPSFFIIQTREYGENIGGGNSSNSSRDESGGSSGSESGGTTPPPGRFGLLTAEYSGEENIFEELDTIRSTSWQYELHQMRLTNKKLREELEALTNSKRKKKRRSQSSGTKICAHCQRKDSPEWRKGPNGPKELCNACGLRE
ncbi:hypothetical protein BC937DRAFT_86388 [Endogone sp. FLAS-F59071]|nr:hypothetical protein BC937DRAFT_86388 [Endogone sp. FLAS-F59071]|eukprot:RUS13075.1 hypothetical protein BC937DRAFT_86388 [Endogone sp. FLAS-F59071]